MHSTDLIWYSRLGETFNTETWSRKRYEPLTKLEGLDSENSLQLVCLCFFWEMNFYYWYKTACNYSKVCSMSVVTLSLKLVESITNWPFEIPVVLKDIICTQIECSVTSVNRQPDKTRLEQGTDVTNWLLKWLIKIIMSNS